MTIQRYLNLPIRYLIEVLAALEVKLVLRHPLLTEEFLSAADREEVTTVVKRLQHLPKELQVSLADETLRIRECDR